MKKSTTIFLVLPLLLLFCKSRAQEVLSSAGATYSSSNLQLSWTVGEPMVETFSGGGTILTQGFQQSKIVVTSTDPITPAGYDLLVYPNPVSGEVNLQVNKGNISKLRIFLYTSQGEQILLKQITNQIEQINMASLAPGYYMLKIARDSNTPVQTFKIVKY